VGALERAGGFYPAGGSGARQAGPASQFSGCSFMSRVVPGNPG